MARAPALLLLLFLAFCCPRIQGQRYRMTVRLRDGSIKQPQLGQRLELECQTSKDDSGMFWVRLDRGGTLHFIVFISYLSRTTFNEGIATRFEAKRDGSSYRLVAKELTPQDEGKYFCIMNSNQMLYFSPGYPVYFPAKTTVAPTTAAPTTAAPTTQNGTTKFLTSNTLHPVTSKKEELNLMCDGIIWVPLAGGCILLLLALIITIILCQKTRRRRCRCKRPANGKPNVKASTPRQYV